MSKTILSSNGYSIDKTQFPVSVLSKCRKDLTIEPYIEKPEYGSKAMPIQIYHETPTRLYMPRFYGLKEFGEPETDKLTKNNTSIAKCPNIKIIDLFELYDSQVPICNKMLNQITNHGGGVLSLYCGAGKCLAIDTPVMMFDGTIKKVQDIKIGDQIMGDDSKPRNILSLARGRETMYKVIPTKGDTYTVNESHILSLKISGHKSIMKYTVKGTQVGWMVKRYNHSTSKFTNKTFVEEDDLDLAYQKASEFCNSITDSNIIDISVKDYLALPKTFHGPAGAFLGYKVGIDFPEKEIDIDPYYLGLWLGDGSSNSTMITNIDKEIIDYLYKYKDQLNKEYGCDLKIKIKQEINYCIVKKNGGDHRDIQNPLYNMLKKYDLLQNKHIPLKYKTNSREIRLKLLAGLIDSDGYLYNNSCYEIVQKRKDLADDVLYLCRSLGFAAYMKECRKQCTNHSENTDGWGTYYRVTFSGSGTEDIPVLVPRKKSLIRQQIKDALSTRIKLEKLPENDYYGFTIDGNHRFLLGDFTVTHNTLAGGLWLASQLKLRTIVVLHTTDMMGQWRSEIEEWMPTVKIGIIQQDLAEIEGKDIILASLKTVAQKQYPVDFFNSVGLVIWDEIHLMCTQLFSDAFPKLSARYSLGLSATPFRKDKCEKIFESFIGPIFHIEKRKPDPSVQVRCVIFKFPVTIEKNFKNDLQYTTTLIGIVYGPERVNYVVKEILELVQTGRTLLVLSEYVDHLKSIKVKLEKIEAFAKNYKTGLYIGELKNEQRMESRKANVILGTYKMASVGMNIPTLDTVILASPRKDHNQLEQSIGRIFRKDTKHNKLIVDLIDDNNIFITQGRARKEFYKLYDYTITQESRDSEGNLLSKKKMSNKATKKDTQKDIKVFLIENE